MNVAQRRGEIVDILSRAEAPIPAKDLAAHFGVTRQVIVQDMAVIRASTSDILSTNQGYVFQQPVCRAREFKVRHGKERTGEELNLIVDCGGRVRNVSISHRIYGRITADLDITSRQDVADFLGALDDSESTLLGSATSGYHYHLVEAATDDRLDLIEQRLQEAGILAPLSQWEKDLSA